jgi:hypothetical protein
MVVAVAFAGVAVPLLLIGWMIRRRSIDEDEEVIAIVHPTPVDLVALDPHPTYSDGINPTLSPASHYSDAPQSSVEELMR